VPIDRRQFLKLAGAQAGALLAGSACSSTGSNTPAPGSGLPAPALSGRRPDVIVIGAGAFGGWTALHLRKMGVRTLLLDAFGPGNSRATSGEETRGIRSSYGERETWVRWAKEAIRRWRQWDQEWSRPFRMQLYFTTGDLILRPEPEPWLTDTLANWDKLRAPYETLTIDEVQYRYPQVDTQGMTVAVVEPDAGVARARRSCEVVAEAFRQAGGQIMIGRAELGDRSDTRLNDLVLSSGERLSAATYVFACGPWLGKVLPDVMANRIRTPIGHVYYFGTPPNDDRFSYPNMPSWNVPGITGWPALPPDARGFRVRTGGRPPEDPDFSQRTVDPAEFERARTFLARRFPLLLNAPLLETRACHYEVSTDRNFIVDRYPGWDNVWIAGGGSAEGFKFGPVVGEYIAQRVAGRRTDPALDREFRLKDDTYPD
jgi:glycine/D-amino acid oxidase-like deaminating enzyme